MKIRPMVTGSKLVSEKPRFFESSLAEQQHGLANLFLLKAFRLGHQQCMKDGCVESGDITSVF